MWSWYVNLAKSNSTTIDSSGHLILCCVVASLGAVHYGCGHNQHNHLQETCISVDSQPIGCTLQPMQICCLHGIAGADDRSSTFSSGAPLQFACLKPSSLHHKHTQCGNCRYNYVGRTPWSAPRCHAPEPTCRLPWQANQWMLQTRQIAWLLQCSIQCSADPAKPRNALVLLTGHCRLQWHSWSFHQHPWGPCWHEGQGGDWRPHRSVSQSAAKLAMDRPEMHIRYIVRQCLSMSVRNVH